MFCWVCSHILQLLILYELRILEKSKKQGGNSMNKRKTFTSLALAAIMTATMNTTAFAAETAPVINDTKDFSNVTCYKITDTVQSEDDRNTYSVALQLSENSSKSVFRPFLKIEYNNGNSGYLVPSVPVYFR